MQRGRQHRLNPCHEQSVQHSDCPSVEGRTPGEVQSGECYRRPPPAAVFCHLSKALESKRVSEAALACVRNWLVLFTVGDAMSRHTLSPDLPLPTRPSSAAKLRPIGNVHTSAILQPSSEARRLSFLSCTSLPVIHQDFYLSVLYVFHCRCGDSSRDSSGCTSGSSLRVDELIRSLDI